MIIDTHTHVWPDAIAERALVGSGLGLELHGDGTVAGLLARMAADGIDAAVCLAVANTAAQVEKANAFAGSLPEPLIGFGSVHAAQDPAEAVESLRRHGLKGVKVHPIFQDYRIDDPGLLAVLDALRGEFVVIMHVGVGHGHDDDRCTPAMLRDLLRQLPGLDLIACHFGGYKLLDEAEEHVIGEDVALDTSWPPSLAELDPRRVRDLILRHGPERVVFASDWPTADPAAEVAAVRALGLDDDVTDAILGRNLARILDLETTP